MCLFLTNAFFFKSILFWFETESWSWNSWDPIGEIIGVYNTMKSFFPLRIFLQQYFEQIKSVSWRRLQKQLILPELCSNAYVKVKRSFLGLESWHNSYDYLLFLQRAWIRVSVSMWQLTTVYSHVLDTYSYMQIQNSDIKLINLKTFKNDLSWYFFK